MSEHGTTAIEPITLRFPHSKDELRRITVKDDFGEYDVYRISPTVANWPAELVPSGVNPRSHDAECLKSGVAKAIEKTLREEPEDFWLANRGGFLLVEKVKFDPERGQLELLLTNDDLHGLADGATTNAVIIKLRSELSNTPSDSLRASLEKARFNMDVVVGLSNRDRVASLVQGRNTSVQVKGWSLNDFRGKFDWLKEFIDREKSEGHEESPFRGKIGWEENAATDWSVLDLISLMTLFHPSYSDKSNRRRGVPNSAFSNKGAADKRFVDEKMAPGYRALLPVLEDIIRFHDHVYAQFEPTYERYNREVLGKGAKLARRRGVDKKATILPLTGTESEYKVEKGLLFPLLAAHRALLHFPNGNAEWRIDPVEFFGEFGLDLVGRLFDEYEKLGKNPAAVGKNRSVYENLYEKAENLLISPEVQSIPEL